MSLIIQSLFIQSFLNPQWAKYNLGGDMVAKIIYRLL